MAVLFCFVWSISASAQSYPVELPHYPNFPRVNVAAGYVVDSNWPQHPPDNACHWGEMPGISVDNQGLVYTFTRGETPVQVYTADGQFVRAWGKDQVGKAHHVRIDHEGNVWLSDIGLHVVRKFTPEGKLLLTLGTPGESGEDSTHFNMPTDVAITPEGHIFVADGYGNNRVAHFGPTGQFLQSWGKMGIGPGEFSLPHSIALDSAGLLYVADRNNARVQIFDQSGRYLNEWRNLCVPWHVWITPTDEVYVCGSSPDRWKTKLPIPGTMVGIPPRDQLVLRLSTDGRVQQITTFPMGVEGQEKPGELNWVHALAVDHKGNLYMGDIKGKRAQKFVALESQAALAPPGELADKPKADEAIKPATDEKP